VRPGEGPERKVQETRGGGDGGPGKGLQNAYFNNWQAGEDTRLGAPEWRNVVRKAAATKRV